LPTVVTPERGFFIAQLGAIENQEGGNGEVGAFFVV
jgi:hypothetical protein